FDQLHTNLNGYQSQQQELLATLQEKQVTLQTLTQQQLANETKLQQLETQLNAQLASGSALSNQQLEEYNNVFQQTQNANASIQQLQQSIERLKMEVANSQSIIVGLQNELANYK